MLQWFLYQIFQFKYMLLRKFPVSAPADVHAEVTADGAGGRLAGLGLAQHFAPRLNHALACAAAAAACFISTGYRLRGSRTMQWSRS